MNKDKKSFFERLTGTVKANHDSDEVLHHHYPGTEIEDTEDASQSSEDEGELTVDVYQNSDEIVIKTMVAGVKPEDLDISITRDMVTIKGTRQSSRETEEGEYFHQELYWGSFSRTIMLPEEVDVEESEANEKYGLLTIRLPKIDKHRQTRLRVRTNS